MKIGRNDPCPCGSGRKYKLCCLPLESGSATPPERTGGVRAAARSAKAWEADLLAVPVEIRSEPDARPGVALVAADGLILDAEFVSRPGAELEEVAAEIARAVERAAQRSGGRPRNLRVRHDDLVAPLSARLGPLGTKVQARRTLPDLEHAANALLAQLGGRPGLGRIAMARTWRAWGLPDEWIARLHAAAAAFFRAAPWLSLTNLDLLHLETASGRTWIAGVLGNDQQAFGLVLYSELTDFARLAAGEMTSQEHDLVGRYLSLTFDPASDLPKEQRREAARAGWEVAAADAYPVLIVANSIGGGLCRADADDLVAALEAVPRYLAADVAESERFTDDPSGLRVEERRHEELRGLSGAAAAALAPGAATGPGARPEGAVAIRIESGEIDDPDGFVAREKEILTRFDRALATTGAGKPTRRGHLDRADTFVEFLAGHRGVPLAAVHEFDLRSFLYDWYPRKVRTSAADARAMPGTLQRFFAFLAESEGIVCPWAEVILSDRATCEERRRSFPGGFFWDEGVQDWIAELTADLDARAFLPDSGLAGGEAWGEAMGPTEARLQDELERRWLVWRDELLASAGRIRPGRLRAALVTRQRDWETTPHPALGGKTPVEAILAERALR